MQCMNQLYGAGFLLTYTLSVVRCWAWPHFVHRTFTQGTLYKEQEDNRLISTNTCTGAYTNTSILLLKMNTIYTINLLKSICLSVCLPVVVRQLQDAIIARSSRETSQTVRIDWHSFLSQVRIWVRPSTFLLVKKTQTKTIHKLFKFFYTKNHWLRIYLYTCDRRVSCME